MKGQQRMTRLVTAIVLAVIVAPIGFARSAAAQDRDMRGIWVTRWDYLTEADIERAMREIDQLGLTDVFWQVRGQADAYYRSDLEPWGEDLFRGPNEQADRTDGPGFDPLAVAVREADKHGLKIHAWINAMPLWKGAEPPRDQSHAWWSRPEWRLHDPSGKPQPLNEHYVIVNPLRDAVRDHIASVARDITARYEVDGIHLDYIRFVTDTMEESAVYPADRASRRLLEARTGSSDLDSPEQRAALRGLIRDAITQTVRDVREAITRERPDAMLTAAVWRRPDLARDLYEQDAAAWVNNGLLDAAIPMIYTADNEQFRGDLRAWCRETRNERIIPGIGVYKHDDGASTVEQIEIAGGDRFVLFAYASLFQSRAPGQDHGPEGRRERERRRSPVERALTR